VNQDPETSNRAGREPISELTTARLSVYLRCLAELESEGIATVSSQDLAARIHVNSAQIRKDLACFGEFGIRGVGYSVIDLRARLRDTLGLTTTHAMVIAGAGNLGMALVNARGFNSDGFKVVAMVDIDPAKTGIRSRNGVEVYPLSSLHSIVKRETVEIGVIAIPGDSAQQVCDFMIEVGILAILNFAPVQIKPRAGVRIQEVDLRVNLETLSFHLKLAEDGKLVL